jgi:dipeptidyl aminopeptidase/acylaminoacyl peptidase
MNSTRFRIRNGLARTPAGLGLLLALSLIPANVSHTQPAPDAAERLAKVRRFTETAIAPDGKRVAWIEAVEERNGAPAHALIAIAELAGDESRIRLVTLGKPCRATGLAWSPDGQRLAFLADAVKAGELQVCVAPATGGDGRVLTDLHGALADPRWSPDGKQIGFLFTDNPPRPIGPVQPGAVETGEIDGSTYYQRLNVVDLASGRAQAVSPPDLYVYEFDWSPDGRHCVLSAAHGSGDNHWYVAQLYVLTAATGRCSSILKPAMQIAVPRWSPDGKTIAFIGGLMSDEGATGGDIYTVAVGGGEPVNRTPNLPASASWIAWNPSSRQLLFTEHKDGGCSLARLDLGAGITKLWHGDETIAAEGGAFGVSAARNLDRFALIRQSFDQPPEVWAGPAGEWRPITRVNRGVQAEHGKARSLEWQSDGERIQGWLLYPRGFDSERRYPLVVHVHGGPAWASMPRWLGPDSVAGALSRRGYFVFFPNPRGSLGKGDRFTRANVKQIGHSDWRDIQAGVDTVLRTVPIDPDRIGITGWSYGGYMTMWAVTQTHRYRAAVAGAGIANWQSYYGQCGIDQWMIPYFGASVYDDPAIYARSSPIDFIKRAKTPTLILVGERDIECPLPQSQEFYRALKTLGVPTKLVVYAGEGHGIARPDHRRDILDRSVAWFEQYLRPR